MSLTSVKMAEEVWLTCLTHALTTETEEIMGLLLGDIQYSNSGNATALIWGASPQMRSDRRKDRVETNPELLAAASAQAEISINDSDNRQNNKGYWVVSFTSSHYSSSISYVRTQAMYQLLEHGFIGLIFSCFSEDAQKVGKIQVIAFQSMDGKQRQAPPVTNSSIIEVESSWSSSDNTFLVSTPALAESFEQDTGDSRVSKASKLPRPTNSYSTICCIHCTCLLGSVIKGREGQMGATGERKKHGALSREEAEKKGWGRDVLSGRSREGKSSSATGPLGRSKRRWGELGENSSAEEKQSGGRVRHCWVEADSVGGKSSDLGELFSYADVNYLGKQRMRENAGADSDSSDMTPSMQEALHRSNMDMRQPPGAYVTMTGSRLNLKHNMSWIIEQDLNLSEAEYGAEYIRKEVPLQVLPASLNPTISALQGRLKENEIRLNMLMEEAQSLEVEARGWKSGMHSESPRSHVARGFRGSPVGTRDLHASADSAVTRAPSGSASRRKAS
ncbi:hypothetical protein MUK42_15650 [Musa troglodytarum]|uniref:BRCC36 C-terminal helical domain-containing protein n=1 Tax=Musa troglodytarum TaxID=320322 RepID=A0A9E7KZS7_9LILI|nr:hypothetical protein MUK42_15650 [Musa troglodytarum]